MHSAFDKCAYPHPWAFDCQIYELLCTLKGNKASTMGGGGGGSDFIHVFILKVNILMKSSSESQNSFPWVPLLAYPLGLNIDMCIYVVNG